MKPCILALHPNLSLADEADGTTVLKTPRGDSPLGRLSPGFGTALRTLAAEGDTPEGLADRVLREDGAEALPVWLYCLDQWDRSGLVTRSVAGPEGLLATLVPRSFLVPVAPAGIDPGARYVLSRFAYLQAAGGRLGVESPLCPARLDIHSPQVTTLLSRLAEPATLEELSGAPALPSPAALQLLLELLAGARMISRVVDGDGGAAPDEERDPVLAQWEFHDLLFHTRSRMGRHDTPSGAFYPFLGRIEPLPAVKPDVPGRVVPLPVPDLATLIVTDPPFARVQEERRSIREYGDRPITLEQLGGFLYRTARLRRLVPRDDENGQFYEVSDRPYPNGGASYEIELYVTVHQCEGLEPGLYHYHPVHHQLHEIAGAGEKIPSLLRDAWESTARLCVPQVLITLTARFQRLSWKYRSMAYATVLKNAGVLYQTMYLVATAMGLAPCGIGNGNAELMAQALGTSFFEESSVGEFLLGSRRD